MKKDSASQTSIADINVSALDSLKHLKQEQDQIDERLQAMAALKDTVAPEVYQRVFNDYQNRLRQLEAEAAPQKQALRTEFAKLRALLERFEAEHETSKLDQQELELRYKLREFDEAAYTARSSALEAVVAAKLTAYEQAIALKARFLEAFHSEADLQQDLDTTAENQIPALNTESEARTDEMPVVQTGIPTSNQTQVMPAVKVQKKPAPATSASNNTQSTVMFRAARLVPQNAEAGKTTFTLGLKPTVIGADSINDVRVAGPGVEAKHAQISVSMAGFTLVDCGSKHGTRVNAEKIRERLLRHEDVIQIGAARFVFREG